MILQEILAYKRQEVDAAKKITPIADLRARIADLEDVPRGFAQALKVRHAAGETTIIAEVKKGSPSKGVIRSDFDPLEIAGTYERNGAACLSVLTDSRFFFGHLSYLSMIREVAGLPLLRKDFVCDPHQIWEARAAGADAVLLIAAALSLVELRDMSSLAEELGMDVLLEVHDEEELEIALQVPVELIGINNRDLKAFVTDLGVTERLMPLIPKDRFVISESGIRCRQDILRLTEAGASAFLIGESLMREEDFGAKLRELAGNR